ncbi:hypothetical protein SDC9_19519 [bioreactor metagenome]|uniref:Uncharacterized protein n=1 Tax=bioreactor metagenome TaxID=1076179 RepID=A0A644U468_9ZZZZ
MLAVLFPGDRLADDARAGLERPQLLAGVGIEGDEFALGVAGEDQPARGRHHPAPERGRVLVFPLHLAGVRVHRLQRADVILEQRLDGEARTQIGRALLVADRLVPDVHAPFVRGHVEEAGLLVVGHRHPVLATKERGHGEDLLALAAFGRGIGGARAVFLVVDRPAVLIDALGPVDLLDEGMGRGELAVLAVQNIEEAVAVGGGIALVAVLVDEAHDLVHAVEIPALAWRGLEVPLDLAGLRVDADAACGIEVVARVALDRRAGVAQVAVPGRRVARAEDQRVGVGVIGTAQPGRATAGLPHVARPGRVERARHGAFLAHVGAHVAFDHRPGPDQLAGLGVARLHLADDAEFAARVAGDDKPVHDQRRRGVGVALLVIGDLLVPLDLAGLQIEREDARVERAEIDVVAIDRRAAVDDVAARQDALGQAGVILPDFLAGLQVDRIHARIRAGDVHHPVVDQRLAFLTALLLAAEAEGPGRYQVFDVVLVQDLERAVALQVTPHPVGQHVLGAFLILQQVLLGHPGHRRRAETGDGQHRGQNKTVHRSRPPDLPITPCPPAGHCAPGRTRVQVSVSGARGILSIGLTTLGQGFGASRKGRARWLRTRPETPENPLFLEGREVGDDEVLNRRILDADMAHLGPRHELVVRLHPGAQRPRRPDETRLLQRLGIGIAREGARAAADHTIEQRAIALLVGIDRVAAVAGAVEIGLASGDLHRVGGVGRRGGPAKGREAQRRCGAEGFGKHALSPVSELGEG